MLLKEHTSVLQNGFKNEFDIREENCSLSQTCGTGCLQSCELFLCLKFGELHSLFPKLLCRLPQLWYLETNPVVRM